MLKKIYILGLLALTSVSNMLNGSACSNTNPAFFLCVANLLDNIEIALNQTITAADKADGVCPYCNKVMSSGAYSGSMGSSFYSVYSSNYGNLNDVQYTGLPYLFNKAGANLSPAFVKCFVNQCPIMQQGDSGPVADCITRCVSFASSYQTWLQSQSISNTTAYEACVENLACWNSGALSTSCFAQCINTATPTLIPTVIPWIYKVED